MISKRNLQYYLRRKFPNPLSIQTSPDLKLYWAIFEKSFENLVILLTQNYIKLWPPELEDLAGDTVEYTENYIKRVTNLLQKFFDRQKTLISNVILQIILDLTERELKVILLRFGFGSEHGYTLTEVGKMFNVTRERIRQIEGKALRKLKHQSRTVLFKESHPRMIVESFQKEK